MGFYGFMLYFGKWVFLVYFRIVVDFRGNVVINCCSLFFCEVRVFFCLEYGSSSDVVWVKDWWYLGFVFIKFLNNLDICYLKFVFRRKGVF